MPRLALEKRFYLWATVWLICSAFPQAHAAQWEICDLQVEINRTQPNRRLLEAQVVHTQAHGSGECPQPGTPLTFRPATLDYQSELPRRLWPQPGETVKLRYRYMDGVCKNRGACRIEHYSPMLR